MKYKIVILPGDGIGREVMADAKKVLTTVKEQYNLNLEFLECQCGAEYYKKTGKVWDDEVFPICKDEADAILLGAIGHPNIKLPNNVTAGAVILFGLRFGLDLYANIRPVKLYPNVKHKISDNFKQVWASENVDFIVARENTEGFYKHAYDILKSKQKKEINSDIVIDRREITRKGSERIIQFAFKLASGRKQSSKPSSPDTPRKVTCVDKSNVLDGCKLFRAVFDKIGTEYPDIEKDHAYVDAFAHTVLREPELYDVVVTTNLFGDILTDLTAVLQGGLGMAPSANLGDSKGLFEPVHGSSPTIAGKNIANPIAMILSSKLMLEWLGNKYEDLNLIRASENLENAVRTVLKAGKVLTPDIGGTSQCSDVGNEINTNLLKID